MRQWLTTRTKMNCASIRFREERHLDYCTEAKVQIKRPQACGVCCEKNLTTGSTQTKASREDAIGSEKIMLVRRGNGKLWRMGGRQEMHLSLQVWVLPLAVRQANNVLLPICIAKVICCELREDWAMLVLFIAKTSWICFPDWRQVIWIVDVEDYVHHFDEEMLRKRCGLDLG